MKMSCFLFSRWIKGALVVLSLILPPLAAGSIDASIIDRASSNDADSRAINLDARVVFELASGCILSWTAVDGSSSPEGRWEEDTNQDSCIEDSLPAEEIGDENINVEALGIDQADGKSFCIHAPSAWPLNGRCEVRFVVPKPCWVRIGVFDLNGDDICTLADDFFKKGEYLCYWDTSSGSDPDVSEGVYLISMQGYGLNEVRKVVLIK
ncbi:hypothetical protein JXM67_05020 [candidate division WOR-3 bacterium]|nr:hypothetical protein [candidate division WOR-3 bacterium]